MVLHNNKWDRKAKTKYLKKHGLAKPVEEKKPQEKWSAGRAGAQDTANSDGHSQSEDEDEKEGASEGEQSDCGCDYTKKPGQSLHQGERHEGIYLGDTPSGSAAPLQELDFEIEAPYQDPSELVAQHIASFKMAPQPRKGSVQVAPNAQEFEDLESDIAAHKLKSDIKRRFGKSKFKLADEEDDFWEAVGPASASTSTSKVQKPQAAKVDAAKQAWLDDLIN